MGVNPADDPAVADVFLEMPPELAVRIIGQEAVQRTLGHRRCARGDAYRAADGIGRRSGTDLGDDGEGFRYEAEDVAHRGLVGKRLARRVHPPAELVDAGNVTEMVDQRLMISEDADLGLAEAGGHQRVARGGEFADAVEGSRAEQHTSELHSLMRISYPVFC